MAISVFSSKFNWIYNWINDHNWNNIKTKNRFESTVNEIYFVRLPKYLYWRKDININEETNIPEIPTAKKQQINNAKQWIKFKFTLFIIDEITIRENKLMNIAEIWFLLLEKISPGRLPKNKTFIR